MSFIILCDSYNNEAIINDFILFLSGVGSWLDEALVVPYVGVEILKLEK